jgi:hypothetical protein
MEIVQKRPVILIIGLAVGLALGLLFGWVIMPVEYSGAGPQHMHPRDQANLLYNLADVYAFDNNRERVVETLGRWDEAPTAICALADAEPDQAKTARLIAMVFVLDASGCPDPSAQPAPEEDGGSWMTTCLLGLLLLAIIGAILWVLSKQNRDVGGRIIEGYDNPPEAMAVLSGGEEQQAIPIARFQSRYESGRDIYDDSFSIENANGDFLGECGVGISESISSGNVKGATAIEVWLFDKNDIRTVTKVIMSDHAFFDEALKAKLAPKGEPILGRLNETIVLETASLIINAVIKDLDYSGDDGFPEQSLFDRFAVELSAWAKEGDFGEPDVQGRIDELNFN